MGRITQKVGAKGSQKWIQKLLNNTPELLNKHIRKNLELSEQQEIEWLSPKKEDDYAEYRDKDFLTRLGIKLTGKPLNDFWPKRGPQWDALGRIQGGKVKNSKYFLVEAKAHIAELVSYSQAEADSSIDLIRKSIGETQKELHINCPLDWTKGLYQYSNRVAHLYLLRKLNDIPAYLVFVYFVNDTEYKPTKREEWDGAIKLVKSLMGLNRHQINKYILDVFINVKDIAKA